MTEAALQISADRPSSDPAGDLFGHAPFARTLAKAIRGYRSSDGIVIGLYGPWGSGKSTVLGYVQRELEQAPDDDRPIIVPFNPWWFSGQEHLAQAFLGQLQVLLPTKYENFRAFGEKLAEFSEALGGVGGAVGGVFGQSWIGPALRKGARMLGRKPKDVPALKKTLSDLLLKQKKRVLVVIDDIDRLAPDEMRQLFTVIKALADFPYVTYLLAFDREVATQAISQQTGLPGDRYLEKIIQVPFEIPRPDRAALQRALFARLDLVMASTPDGRFDQMHWTNVFNSGLDPLIVVPRDVVRLTNALSVTYPPVVGEVNPVDFIAIEALRVFLPSVYDEIRRSPAEFVGHPERFGDRDAEKKRAQAFHNGWLQKVSENLRDSTKSLIERLFPRLESVWSNMTYGSSSAEGWRRNLRVCAPEIFPAYFKLSLAIESVSRADIDTLLAAAQSPELFGATLRAAAGIEASRGTSKAQALLDRFMDHVDRDLAATDAEPIVTALFAVGDDLLEKERNAGAFDFGNESRVARIAYHLIRKVDPAERGALLKRRIVDATALRCSQYLIGLIDDDVKKADRQGQSLFVTQDEIIELKAAWVSRLEQFAESPDFIDHQSIAFLLRAWREWGNPKKAIAWWQSATRDYEALLKLIFAHASMQRSQSGSDLGWRHELRVNPKSFEVYGDVLMFAQRVQSLIEREAVSLQYLPAAKQFVRECKAMEAGQDPDSLGFLEDDLPE